jgi:hypothetical protein
MIPFLPNPANYGPDVPPLVVDCNSTGGACQQSCQGLYLNLDGSLQWFEFAGCAGGDPASCALAHCGIANSGGLFPLCAKKVADVDACTGSNCARKPLAWTVVDAPPCSVPSGCPIGNVYDSLSESCVLKPPTPFIPPVLPTFPPACGLVCPTGMKLDVSACRCVDPPIPTRSLNAYFSS